MKVLYVFKYKWKFNENILYDNILSFKIQWTITID